MSNQNERLTSTQQYRYELSLLPTKLTQEEEHAIREQACAGDEQARNRIIENCLRYVACIARRYQCYIQHDDYLDLVQVGNLAVAENIERALTKENTHAYLFGIAKCAIGHYCATKSNLVTKSVAWVESLDAPMREGEEMTLLDCLAAPDIEPEEEGEKPDYTSLYDALETLSERYREVLTRHYGLYENPQESLYKISRELSANPGPKSCTAYSIEYRALANLRRELDSAA